MMRHVLTLALVIGCWTSAVCYAQDFASDTPVTRSLSRAERRLVGRLAKVSFNEALDSEDDLALIWQIVQSQGETASARYHWLGAHSPCVSGVLSQDQARERPGNCRWTRNLTPDGRRPRGWDRELHGRWDWVRPRWLAHVGRAIRFVRGDARSIMCPTNPVSWDGARWRDRILARGFTILECKGDLRNVGVIRE